MKTVHHNGNVHQIVDGLELFELTHGNITMVLPVEANYFRFTVTGTDYHTGLRSQFKFMVYATIRRAARGSLDLKYIQSLIEETVRDVLARENHFVTGDVKRGDQFDRAFAHNILSPQSIAYRLPMGRTLVFGGRIRTDGLSKEEIEGLTSESLFVVETKDGLYTYSVEDTAKWGVNQPATAKVTEEEIKELVHPVHRHFTQTLKEGASGELSFFVQENGKVKLVLKTGQKLQMGKPKPSANSAGYAIALYDLDKQMKPCPDIRLPWRTGMGASRS